MIGAIPLAWNLAGSMTGHFGLTQEYEVSSGCDVSVANVAVVCQLLMLL